MEGPRGSPVERLPVEITQKVLSTITDLLSLRCAALSCPAFFYAFNNAENAITTCVLSMQVGFDVLPEAIAASESSQLPSHTEDKIQEFVANHLRERRSPPVSWTLASALPIGKFHNCVSAFAPFDDVAEHDITWGELRVEYGVGIDSPYIQHLLSLGLKKLHQIIAAETYEARYKLLNDRRFSRPRIRSDFLYDALDNVNEPDDDTPLLSDFTPEDERSHIRPPFFDDPDPGPAEIWRWAYQDETKQQFVYQKSRGPLREWGYVMWDSRRPRDLGILQKPFDTEGAWNASRLDLDQEGRHRAEMAMSWEARSKIYMARGRGWWSVGDHSKIVWKGRKTPHERPYIRAHTKPISVEDARDTLQMMKLPSSVTEFLDRQGT
ncbi:zinc finger domain-containing protein [Fusarium phyllophilum]|uniref:Zinc finger domain-containing protein n=1 Tax=Fusarium phyllophilum TaxID=47803 RepID=A0A8H5MLS5_9HYPO|nr:zinc finger domain-containing protein [Fusarium phyllophilum]